MENLVEKENELCKRAESGDYWDILELADFLYDQKRYDEAEEQYLKIAGYKDISGDANAHFTHLLLDIERYDEAIVYYDYVFECYGTSPREGIYVRMQELLFDGEAPIWRKLENSSFYDLLRCHESRIKEFIEAILLARLESDDEEIINSARRSLFVLYYTGKYSFPLYYTSYTVDMPDFIDLEKAKQYSSFQFEGVLENPKNPVWLELSVEEFNSTIAALGTNDLKMVEEILQNRTNSKNDAIRKSSMRSLLQIYLEGYYHFEYENGEKKIIDGNWNKNNSIKKLIKAFATWKTLANAGSKYVAIVEVNRNQFSFNNFC